MHGSEHLSKIEIIVKQMAKILGKVHFKKTAALID